MQTLSQNREAREAYRQAINHLRVAFDQAPQVSEYRQLLSQSCIGLSSCARSLGDAGEAASVTRIRKSLWEYQPNELYGIAFELAQCVPIVTDGEGKRMIADESIQSLKQAVAMGWKDAVKTSRDPALDALRDREDFRRLLGELFDHGFPADPFAR
jgi:hypothetical protein